jgi:hypothetical protein
VADIDLRFNCIISVLSNVRLFKFGTGSLGDVSWWEFKNSLRTEESRHSDWAAPVDGACLLSSFPFLTVDMSAFAFAPGGLPRLSVPGSKWALPVCRNSKTRAPCCAYEDVSGLSSSLTSRALSRRALLSGSCTLGLSGVLLAGLGVPDATSAAEERPGLPPGARQFNNLRAARAQWAQIRSRLDAGASEITAQEWDNLRGYLRIFYDVSDDMEFLSNRWEGVRRDRVKSLVRELHTTIKAMDKDGIRQDKDAFAAKHASVTALVDEFYELLKAASANDVPEDL